ncbi:hypothetical protein OPV22_009565 [Ensete ventricosum]|uniref:Protein transport protein sec16 n=1 Tax=Ensete ventricosum TaxID=4639 RepID=A0AAV8R5F7_ENSVE|nr:hypothetical protein OPV22_009565 [Ensete ventricosum]
MGSPSPFQVEDQTDEDFFDKLVDDDFGVEGSVPHPKDIVRDISSLRLDDVATPLEDPGNAGLVSEPNGPPQSGTLQSSESPKKDLLVCKDSASSNSPVDMVVPSENSSGSTIETGPQSLSNFNNVGSKGTSVKEVQWSAFSVSSQQLDNVGLETYSDFLAENADPSADKLKSNCDPNSAPVDNQIENIDTYTSSLSAQDMQLLGSATEPSIDGDSQYWESIYPGWKYDAGTGQWYQLDAHDATTNTHFNSYDASAVNSQGNFKDNGEVAALDSNSGSSDVLYLQQASQSYLETIAEESMFNTTSNWSLGYQGTTEYPPNMVFDPQYPGWYYDTNTQQWCTLESYSQTTQMTPTIVQNKVVASVGISEVNYNVSDEFGQPEQSANGVLGSQEFGEGWNNPTSSYVQPNMLHAEQVGENRQSGVLSEKQQIGSFYSPTMHAGSHTDHFLGFGKLQPVVDHNFGSSNGIVRPHDAVHSESLYQMNNQMQAPSIHKSLSNSYLGNQNTVDYSQHSFHGTNDSYTQFSYVPHEGRSSAGRPAHALVAFGFGGKLIVMPNASPSGTNLNYGNQETAGGTISILSLSEVVLNEVVSSSSVSGSVLDYFRSLCHQNFPGPLAGGNAATKDANKWIDERISSYESPVIEFQKGKRLKLLFSLLKISLQHYGKLRSPFGSDPSLEDVNSPEMAVTKLFASSKMGNAPLGEYGLYSHCLTNIPSEGQLEATATKVQSLLVSGRRKEALQCAEEGHLWGPALVLAAQLGDKFYVDTVKRMAQHQFTFGSPLRTLCLLIAGQPADIFSMNNLVTSSSVASPRQPAEIQASGMLDEWEENLAIITANRTKDDKLVILHLGDCLWKERGEVTAAHTCYLIAEENIESYSDSARLCLIGADHWKYPRTYATPDAIQRTELYEYSKVLGNSQFILQSFQPYKLIYAYMLAEVGKISDSLKYCQASLKLLKNSGRTSDVEMWKSMLSSLEERLRTHQQGGYGTSLAPANLVGKLFTTFDRSIHRMIGAPPAPLPPMPQGSVNDKETYSVAPRVANSQSTMAMSSLVPSASVETMSEWKGDDSKQTRHNRSISEPDFGRSPEQDSSSDAAQSKKTASSGSRFGRIGSQLLQKTMGWVSRSHRQVKLGQSNKFYYDEQLKTWVEEGAEPPAAEPALPPPPTATTFQNGMPDYNISNTFKSVTNINDAFKRESLTDREGPVAKPLVPLEQKSTIPPTPPSQNQFSARGRMGVRSRYVDTFNKGGGALTNTFQSPAVPSMKPLVGAKFFVPTAPAAVDEGETDAAGESNQEVTNDNEEPSKSATAEASFSSQGLSSSSSSMQRVPSMDNITPLGNKGSAAAASWSGNGGPLSRMRAASWSGTYANSLHQNVTGMNPASVGHGMTTSLPSNTAHPGSVSSLSLQQNGGSLGDDLHEVEL